MAQNALIGFYIIFYIIWLRSFSFSDLIASERACLKLFTMNKIFIIILLLVLFSVSTPLSRKNTSPKKKQKTPPTVAPQDLCDIYGELITFTNKKLLSQLKNEYFK